MLECCVTPIAISGECPALDGLLGHHKRRDPIEGTR